ncbi:uncharacterized protein LOC134286387 [Aedes albopictus]|uniref:Uncharacterized protein n=1 Tax=Aedes albopictus TaxID=7160 RepID=A0ABM1YDD3_AEDAL
MAQLDSNRPSAGTPSFDTDRQCHEIPPDWPAAGGEPPYPRPAFTSDHPFVEYWPAAGVETSNQLQNYPPFGRATELHRTGPLPVPRHPKSPSSVPIRSVTGYPVHRSSLEGLPTPLASTCKTAKHVALAVPVQRVVPPGQSTILPDHSTAVQEIVSHRLLSEASIIQVPGIHPPNAQGQASIVAVVSLAGCDPLGTTTLTNAVTTPPFAQLISAPNHDVFQQDKQKPSPPYPIRRQHPPTNQSGPKDPALSDAEPLVGRQVPAQAYAEGEVHAGAIGSQQQKVPQQVQQPNQPFRPNTGYYVPPAMNQNTPAHPAASFPVQWPPNANVGFVGNRYPMVSQHPVPPPSACYPTSFYQPPYNAGRPTGPIPTW